MFRTVEGTGGTNVLVFPFFLDSPSYIETYIEISPLLKTNEGIIIEIEEELYENVL